LTLLPGVSVLGYFLGIDQAEVILAIMAAAFSLLILAYLRNLQQHFSISHPAWSLLFTASLLGAKLI